ncbi:MAG: sulfotransferase [Candidatus Omnitrophota bacterium]|nr:sulfotransferase [Candidatus Omnitrophota bacterium]
MEKIQNNLKNAETAKFQPNLFILGAAKCGTTTLHFYLDTMPEICMSMPKEPHFFEKEYDKGITFYRDKYFAHWNGEAIIGEARHRNLFLPYVAERIYRTNPQAKLVAILRNPVARAYSHWWHFYSRGHTKLSFSKTIRANRERLEARLEIRRPDDYFKRGLKPYVNKDTCIESGYYFEQIQRYRAYFSDSQIKLILFEDLVQNPQQVLADLRALLGLEPESKIISPLTNMNPHKLKQVSLPLRRIQKKFRLREILPDFAYEYLKHFFKLSLRRPRMPGHTHRWLIQHYEVHNEMLASYMNRDLSHWNRMS